MTNELLFYLIYPAVISVISAIFTYLGSYFLNKKEKNSEKESLKQDFIEKMIIALDSLYIELSRLSDDPIKYNYFALQNIGTVKPVLKKLQNITEDKLSLFREYEFRSNILNLLNEANSIINEIESKELNPVNKYTEHKNIVKEATDEYNVLKMKLLEMQIYLDNNNEPKYMSLDDNSTNPTEVKTLEQVKLLIQNLNLKINNSQNQLDTINNQTKDQRSFLAVKLLNIQSKVKDLISDLKNKRQNIN